jgi:hypothetical protein
MPSPSTIAGGLTLVRDAGLPVEIAGKLKTWQPKSQLGEIVRDCFKYLPAELAAELLDRITRSVVLESRLEVVVLRGPTSEYGDPGQREDHGVTSRKVVTTTGAGYIVDAFQPATSIELENMKYHGLGTSSAAEATGDTALTTELTTQYNPDNTRATGTTAEASALVYQTVGTNTLDASATVQEHGILSQAATGGGVLLDRSLTGAQTLSSGDSLQSTYSLTFTAGG